MASQTWPVGQTPHACTLPQPSGMLPQRPSHAMGLHKVHWLFSHLVPKPQVLLHAKPLPQASATMPHPLSPPHASVCATQVLEIGWQIWPCAQVPHWRALPQLSLTSPHGLPRLAQVPGTQSGGDTVILPPSRGAPPVAARGRLLLEATPPEPCTGGAASSKVVTEPPVPKRLPSSVSPPWPLPEAPPLDAGLLSVFGVSELPLLQDPRRNSHVHTIGYLCERFMPLPPSFARIRGEEGKGPVSSKIHSEAHATPNRSKGQANLAAHVACLSKSPSYRDYPQNPRGRVWLTRFGVALAAGLG